MGQLMPFQRYLADLVTLVNKEDPKICPGFHPPIPTSLQQRNDTLLFHALSILQVEAIVFFPSNASYMRECVKMSRPVHRKFGHRLTASSMGHFCNEDIFQMLRNELYAILQHMSYTCLADLVHPRKLRRSAGTYIPCLTQSVLALRPPSAWSLPLFLCVDEHQSVYRSVSLHFMIWHCLSSYSCIHNLSDLMRCLP